ncbi:MAG: uncharacterized protein JWN44_5548 [Myxococcales bacterium]|nr:uncharacterized protein [Myxococcales bacterium]
MVAVANANATFADLLARPDCTQSLLQTHLDALDVEERVRQCRALGKKQQRRLWEVSAEAPAFTLEDLIPSSATAEVRWAGKNSLPLFTHFEKRFFRQSGTVVGYNFNPGIAWFTGPGYFTTVQAPGKPKEILFDYTQVPSVAPSGWPAVKPNTGGTGKLVYGGMHDFCRRVCQTVIIGAATRLGKPIDAYFVLART